MIIFVPKKAKRNKIITSFSFAFFKKNYANIYKLKNNIKSKKFIVFLFDFHPRYDIIQFAYFMIKINTNYGNS